MEIKKIELLSTFADLKVFFDVEPFKGLSVKRENLSETELLSYTDISNMVGLSEKKIRQILGQLGIKHAGHIQEHLSGGRPKNGYTNDCVNLIIEYMISRI